MNFEQFRRARYQAVPVSPDEPNPWRGVADGSDIVAHLPVLEYYASRCHHVTELGVRSAYSTCAFLASLGSVCPPRPPTTVQLHSYDIEESSAVRELLGMSLPCQWEFHTADTGADDFDIAPTDLLFFDTLHTYEHLKKELRVAHRARRYLAFHDTETCGEYDRSGPNRAALGINPAIDELILSNRGRYRTVYKTRRNNGLWVLEVLTP